MDETVCEEELLALMKKINIRLEIQLEHSLREEDISGVQAYLMVYIWRHHPKGTYVSQLCKEMGVSKTNMSLLVKKLRQKGYLSFQENAEDDRKKWILPTQQMRTVISSFIEKASCMEKEICSSLDSKERCQLKVLEKKILERCIAMDLQRKKKEVIEYENRFSTVKTI